jgi:hypothetical protein
MINNMSNNLGVEEYDEKHGHQIRKDENEKYE